MNSKVYFNSTFAALIAIVGITTCQSGCGETAATPTATAQNETPHVESMRDLLKKIVADGKDKKAMSDLGMSYPMALARNQQIVEPTKPLFDKLKSASTPEDRQKIAQEMLDQLSPAKS